MGGKRKKGKSYSGYGDLGQGQNFNDHSGGFPMGNSGGGNFRQSGFPNNFYNNGDNYYNNYSNNYHYGHYPHGYGQNQHRQHQKGQFRGTEYHPNDQQPVEIPSNPVSVDTQDSSKAESEPKKQKKDVTYENYLLYPGEMYALNNDLVEMKRVFKIKQGNLLSKRAVILKKASNNQNQVISLGKIYIPSEGDIVIGIVSQKFSDFYKVDINSCTAAMLFKNRIEGNKNSKVEFEVGDLLLARVVSNDINDAPQLSTEKKLKKDISLYCDLNLGKLDGGNVTDIPLNKVNKLTKTNSTIKKLKNLRGEMKVCVGNNGKLYVTGEEDTHLNLFSQLVLESLEKKEDLNFDYLTEKINSLLIGN